MKLPADRVSKLRAFYEGRAVCVTGGAGFIGGHIVDALLGVGAEVSVIDDLSNSSLEHLSPHLELEPDRVRFVHGSILDDAAMEEAADGCRMIIHLAAIGSVPRSLEEPQRTWSVNATGTLRVLEAARKARCERVVAASSSSVYGDQPGLPKVETMTPLPLSPYAASKLSGEHLLSVWSKCYGLSTASLRYFNVFGPRQATESAYAAVVAAFVKRLLNGEPPRIFGDGTQTRDMTFVSNAVLATLLAGSCAAPLAGEAFNVGTGQRVSVLELAMKLAKASGMPHVQPAFAPARSGDVQHSLADITRARQVLGYEPVSDLDEGLSETVDWFKRAFAGA